MNAESLLGTTLGTCTLQQLIGQGGMGAVYLAQQSRPRRQVAVKVLMPLTSLTPVQMAAFLERFRRETDAAASLEHPNIMPVHEYGERNNFAYLVMPYISGGTLRDEMEREEQFPLTKVVNYLEQLASALDFAHKHGVIHRDIKPANILMTPEGRLLLTDFGLVKIVTEGQAPQVRLTGEGAPVGTPDYMAPEQVIGEEVDGRSDLYSLGVILYQMVTGTTPFQGETPMQIAAQQLRSTPPSPRELRPDLPMQVERVILRSMEKRPDDRYPTGRALVKAFLDALDQIGIPLDTGARAALNGATAARLLIPTGQFEIVKPTGMLPSIKSGRIGNALMAGQTNTLPSVTTTTSLPAAKAERSGGLLSKTGKFPQMAGGQFPQGGQAFLGANAGERVAETGSTAMLPTFPNANTTTLTAPSTGNLPPSSTLDVMQLSPTLTTTGSMPVPGRRNTVKLTSSLKVVQMELAGQPGQYVTGLLPTIPKTPPGSLDDEHVTKKRSRKRLRMIAALVTIMVLLFSTIGTVWFVRFHGPALGTRKATTIQKATAPDTQATAFAQATATTRANIILNDPLSTNTNNWQTNPPDVYSFKDGAYHITDHGTKGRATILQSSTPFSGPLGYLLTMEEIKGNDTSPNDSFGMIMRFSQQNKAGKTITTFYSFEVVNNKGGEYQFWKYDDGTGAASPWTEIWHQQFGNEFHQGHGVQSANTFKVFMNGTNFTFTVNGKLIKSVQDRSFQSGTVGMLVNLDGTEVAFKNLLLTRN